MRRLSASIVVFCSVVGAAGLQQDEKPRTFSVSGYGKVFYDADGAGANVGRNWYVLESQDYPSLDALIETFCDFLRHCLAGHHPLNALEEARR